MVKRLVFLTLVAAFVSGQQCASPIWPSPNAPRDLPRVTLQTTEGNIIIELFETGVPEAVATFLDAVRNGAYDDTIIHEVNSGAWFIGGRYDTELNEVPGVPVTNGSQIGLLNLPGRVALYTPPGEATAPPAFLINLAENPELDFDPGSGEPVDYTVIGRVVEDIELQNGDGDTLTSVQVAIQIGDLDTESGEAADGTPLENLPAEMVIITRAVEGTETAPARPVVADAGPDATVTAGDVVTLDGSGSDALLTGQSLTFMWEQVSGPSVSLSNATAEKPTFTAPAQPGELTFRLTVRDGLGNSDTDEVTLTVERFVIDAGEDKYTRAGEEAMLDASGTEALVQGDTLTLMWVQTAGPPVALSDPTAEQPTFINPSGASVLTFELTATDSLGNSKTDSVTLTVLVFQEYTDPETEAVLRYADAIVGDGEAVQQTSTIRARYIGRHDNEDGDIFDQTGDRPPFQASLDLDTGNVIDGWKLGLGMFGMRVGGTRILIIPPELAYGVDTGHQLANQTLWFQVEVVEIVE